MTQSGIENIQALLQEQQFLESQLSLSESDYENAIEELIKVAMQDTGQSKVTAQVLLSMYDGHDFHLAVSDLCGLDTKLFYAALIAIRGRVILMKEPHAVISDGKKRFEILRRACMSVVVIRRFIE